MKGEYIKIELFGHAYTRHIDLSSQKLLDIMVPEWPSIISTRRLLLFMLGITFAYYVVFCVSVGAPVFDDASFKLTWVVLLFACSRVFC